jgi:hypothetical protein
MVSLVRKCEILNVYELSMIITEVVQLQTMFCVCRAVLGVCIVTCLSCLLW